MRRFYSDTNVPSYPLVAEVIAKASCTAGKCAEDELSLSLTTARILHGPLGFADSLRYIRFPFTNIFLYAGQKNVAVIPTIFDKQ